MTRWPDCCRYPRSATAQAEELPDVIPDDLLEVFRDRVQPFNTDAALHYAELAVRAKTGLAHAARPHRGNPGVTRLCGVVKATRRPSMRQCDGHNFVDGCRGCQRPKQSDRPKRIAGQAGRISASRRGTGFAWQGSGRCDDPALTGKETGDGLQDRTGGQTGKREHPASGKIVRHAEQERTGGGEQVSHRLGHER